MNRKNVLTIAVVFATIIWSVSPLNFASAQVTCDPDALTAVKYGQRSAAVKNTQACLIELGYDIAAGPTGYYGGQTAAAAKSFYKDNLDMVWSKTVGPQGIAAMQDALAGGVDTTGGTDTGATGGTTDTNAQLTVLLKALGLTDAQITAILAAVSGTSSTATTTATTGTVNSTGTVTVGLAADNPAAGTIPDGSIFNSVLRVSLAASGGDVAVSGITLQRSGYIANTNVTGVSIWDDAGNRYGNIVTALTSDGKATIAFGSTPFNVLNGTTKALTVKINLDASTGSATVGFAATEVTVSGTAKVVGTLPITGNLMGVVDGSASLGNLYVDDQAVGGYSDTNATSTAAGNVDIGDLQREVAKIRLTQNNSKEAITLNQLIVYVNGTIEEAKDLKNWGLYAYDGKKIASAEKSVNRYVTFNLATPYLIDKGLSRDFSVKVDIADGAGRYFLVYIMNDYDVIAKGATTGAFIQPLDSAGAAFTSADAKNTTTGTFKMKSGSLTVSKALTSPSGNTSPSAQNVVLATYDLRANGEKLEIQKMGVQIDIVNASASTTGTLFVKDAATGETYLSISADTASLQVVAAPTAATLLTNQRNLSTYITIESGQSKTIQVVATVPSTATSGVNYTANVGQFYTKRYSTNDYTDLAATAYTGNQITVSAVALTVTKNAAYSDFSKSNGSSGVKLAEFVLQASNADDINVNTITLNLAGTTTDVQNLRIQKSDGTQLGNSVGSPSATGNTYTISGFTINKAQSVALGIYGDIASGAVAAGTTTVSIASSGISATGVSSSVAVTGAADGAVAGQIVTIASPTLTITKDSDSPISRIIINGQTGVEVGRIKLEATAENIHLKKITLMAVSASTTWWTATATPANISKIYLYDGATLLNSGGTSLVSGSSTISGIDVTVPQNDSKVLSVKIDSADAGNSVPFVVASIGVFSTTTTDLEAYSPSLMTTGITLTANASSSNMLFTNTAPTIASAMTSGEGSIQIAAPIGKYTITNTGTRDMTITQLEVALTIAGATSSSSALSGIALWESTNEGTAIATTNLISSASGISAATTTSGATTTSIFFTTFTQKDVISAGASKTYIVVANTTAIESLVTNPGQNTANVSTYINGVKGSSFSTGSAEVNWNDGKVTYSYTGTGQNSSNTYAGNLASDSGVVYGATLSY